MAFQRSLQLTLIIFFILLSHPYSTIAQIIPTSIQNIMTNTVVDLYVFNNFGSDDNSLIWDYYDAQGPIARSASTFNESVELIAGSAEAAGNGVVDIAATHVSLSLIQYYWPASLPLGLYHFRINSTVNTSSAEGQVIQDLSARSATINVTTSKPVGCGPKVPAPFTNVTSPSSPDFTSVFITSPSAGQNIAFQYAAITDLYQNGTVDWVYRDTRNNIGPGGGISNATAQVQDSTTGAAIGPVQTERTPGGNGILVDFNNVPVQVGGSYKIFFTYRNNIQDGLVSPGNVISFTTEEFNVVNSADYQNDCANVSSSGSGSSSTGSSGGLSGGAGRILPGLKYVSLIVTGLASISLVF